MSTGEERRPRLEVAMEQLRDTTDRLATMCEIYRPMRDAVTSRDITKLIGNMAGLSIELILPNGGSIPVGQVENNEAGLELLTNGVNYVGEQIVTLWKQVHAISTDAVAICEQAAAAAAVAQAAQG